jgi:hypothetical protein
VSCTTMTSLGAYVLGALDERDRDRVEDHVAACDCCREELEALIPVRSYLARVSAEELLEPDAPVPPAALMTRLRAAVRAERRRAVRRRAVAVVALAAVVLAAVVAWRAGEGRPAGDRAPLAAAPAAAAADARTGVRATVAATPRAWGTELRVRVSGAAPGERCRLVARARDGRADVAATWWTTYSGSAELTGAAAIPAADLVALDVVTSAGHRLVRVPMNQQGGPA